MDYFDNKGHHFDDVDEIVEQEKGIPKDYRSKIIDLDILRVKPEIIIEKLRKEGVVIQKMKLNEKKRLGDKKLTLNDWVKWVEARKEIPSEKNTVFVPKYEFETFPEIELRIFITKKR